MASLTEVKDAYLCYVSAAQSICLLYEELCKPETKTTTTTPNHNNTHNNKMTMKKKL